MTVKEVTPLVYSPDEARRLLKISRGLMYEAIHTGQIPNIRLGRRILIPRAALERLLGITNEPTTVTNLTQTNTGKTIESKTNEPVRKC